MPTFKNKETGDTVKVSEEHANQVLRKQGAYVEVEEKVKEPAKEATSYKKGKG